MARFRREAKAVASIEHSNVVPVYEVDEDGETQFFTMRLMEGGTLRSPLAAIEKSARGAAAIVEKIARAVHVAHEAGVLHRDLKPENILLDADGLPAVSDFGLAGTLEDEDSLTLSGQILGTASYMAPEHASGRHDDVGRATDVYGLGATLYELLVGEPPFTAPSTIELLRKFSDEEPRRLRSRKTSVPRDLESICLKCPENDPRRRPRGVSRRPPIRTSSIGPIGRSFRWCRRNRAATIIGALLLTVAVSTSFLAWRLDVESALSRLSEAEAIVRTPRQGQRLESLRLLENSRGEARPLRYRSALASALALDDIEAHADWTGWEFGVGTLAVDPDFAIYARGYRSRRDEVARVGEFGAFVTFDDEVALVMVGLDEDDADRAYCIDARERASGDAQAMAELLGVHKRTIYKIRKRLGS